MNTHINKNKKKYVKKIVPALITIQSILAEREERVIDDTFQRDSVWDLELMRDYIDSVFEGLAASSIILADIPSCLKASIEAEGTKSYGAKRLSSQQKNQFEKSILDGLQRTDTIFSFVNNEFTITGTYIDADGTPNTVENKFFRDLPQRLKDAFYATAIPEITMYSYTYREMVKEFTAIQKGSPLSDAEKRWALLTPYNPWVKQRRKVFKSVFLRIGKAKQAQEKANRKKDVEVLDQTILSLMPHTKEKDCGPSNLDDFYKKGDGKSDLKQVSIYKEDELDRAWDIYRTRVQPIIECKTQVAIRTYWAIVYISEYLYDNKLDIKKGKVADLYEFISKLDRKLYDASKVAQADEVKKQQKAGSEDIVPDSKYYFWRCSVPQQYKAREKRAEELLTAFVKEFPKDLFSEEDVAMSAIA